jgi:hypothetical protein
MTPEQFCYWLQGLLEGGKEKSLSPEQIRMIKDHLNTVFEKVTPTRSSMTGTEALKNYSRLLCDSGGLPRRYC